MTLIKVKQDDFTSNLKLTRAVSKGGLLIVKNDWCGHCVKAIPILENVSRILGKSFDIYIIDGDSNPSFVSKANIDGFPTIFYINKKGTLDKTFKNLRTEQNILQFICTNSLVCLKK